MTKLNEADTALQDRPDPGAIRPGRRLRLGLVLPAAIAALTAIVSSSASFPIRAAAQTPTHESCGNAAATADAQAKLAAGLIQGLAKHAKAGENVIVSPASLAGAFETLSFGANDSMNTALIQTLRYTVDAGCPPASLFKALEAVQQDLAKNSGGAVRIANKIVLDPSLKLRPRFSDVLEHLGREIAVDDLSKPEAIGRVNDWVKEKTKGLIPVLLDGPLESPALTVLNALHFKAGWARKFDPAATKPHDFASVSGPPRRVMMMELPEAKYLFREEAGFTGLELPFAGNHISLIVVAGTGKPLTAAGFAAASSFLDGAKYAEHGGSVELPRLQLSASQDLLPELDGHGLAKAAKDPDAFGAFAPKIRLSSILQRVEMSADEDGAEAAAATAVTTSRSFETGPIHFVLDKPFLFALRDQRTGLILAAGYVAKPGPEAGGAETKPAAP